MNTWDLGPGGTWDLGLPIWDLAFGTWDLGPGTWVWDLGAGTWLDTLLLEPHMGRISQNQDKVSEAKS